MWDGFRRVSPTMSTSSSTSLKFTKTRPTTRNEQQRHAARTGDVILLSSSRVSVCSASILLDLGEEEQQAKENRRVRLLTLILTL